MEGKKSETRNYIYNTVKTSVCIYHTKIKVRENFATQLTTFVT